MSNDRPNAGCAPEDALFYKHLLDRLNDGVYFVDHERHITYWNQGAAKLTGFAAEEAMGRHCHDDFLCHVDRSGERLCTNKCPLSATITDGESREAFVFLRHKAGHRVSVHVRVAPIYEHSRVIGAVEIFNDSSDRESAQRRAEHLQKLAFLDPLTRVANRRYLEIRLQSAIQELPFRSIRLAY
jgi:PAS domain S-box-containing protein